VPALLKRGLPPPGGPAALPSTASQELIMPISLYRRRIAATVIQLAKDDPSLVKEVIARLRESGEIEADDLVYLDRIADRWMRIAEDNGRQAASTHPRQARG
jgi:hypothetical protein